MSSSDPGPFQQLQDCLTVIDTGAATAETYLARGRAYQQLGSLEAAVDDFGKVIELLSKSDKATLARAHDARCQCLRQLSQYPQGIADGERAVNYAPEQAQYWLNLGHIRYWAADYVGALSDVNQALQLDPATWEAYAVRGRIQRAVGDAWRAIDDYTTAIQNTPNPPALYYLWRAGAYIILGGYREAEADCTLGLSLDPNHWQFYSQRGHARFHGLADLEGALNDFTQSIRLNQEADTYLGRGLVYQALGAENAATADFTQFIQRHPKGTGVGMQELTALLSKLKRPPAAVST